MIRSRILSYLKPSHGSHLIRDAVFVCCVLEVVCPLLQPHFKSAPCSLGSDWSPALLFVSRTCVVVPASGPLHLLARCALTIALRLHPDSEVSLLRAALAPLFFLSSPYYALELFYLFIISLFLSLPLYLPVSDCVFVSLREDKGSTSHSHYVSCPASPASRVC